VNTYDDTEQQPSRTGQAAKGAAKKGAKKAGKSLAKKLIILLGVKGFLLVLVIGLVLLVIAAAAGAISNTAAAAQPAGCGGTPASAAAQPAVSGSAPGVTAEQNGNAQAIINVALGLGLGYQGALIGVLTADVEADLVNVNIGDMTGPGGSMSTSRGLFQQIGAWGPLADRMDPTKSATMFYTGGQAGQKGLTSVSGWQSMAPEIAMQAIQQSEFTQQPGNQSPGLAAKLALATSVTTAIMGAGNTPAPAAAPVAAPVPCPAPAAAAAGAVNVAVNGVAVTIPDNPNVAAAVRGKVIQAPNAGVAKGLAAGFGTLGTMYVWGGGFGPGGGATNGCDRGGGQLNSHCDSGPPLGWDCSGLVNYVLVQGGFPSPGDNSDAQRSTGTDIPWDQGVPGDAIGYPGHISVFLGVIDGTPYQLEASDVGTANRVIAVFRSDHDPVLHRHWS
jgi:cell wall-associated NlpC family hydrolase